MTLLRGESGSAKSTNKWNMYARVNWWEDYCVEEGYSIVSISIETMTNEVDYFGKWRLCGTYWEHPAQISIGGENVLSVNFDSPADYMKLSAVNTWVGATMDGGKTVSWSSGKIYHDELGEGSTTIEVANLCVINKDSGDIFVFGAIPKLEISLTKLPRKSSITSAFDTPLGKACCVSWIPKADSFRYKLEFSLGNWGFESEFIEPKTTQEFTYSGYTLPIEVANQIPNAASGTMSVTLRTYTGDIEVGSDTAAFEVTVPDNADTKPSITDLALVAVDTPFSGVFIQRHSKVKATVAAEGKYSAEIVSSKMTVEGNTYTGDLASKVLSGYGDTKVKISVTDSRGFTATQEAMIYVCAYSNPTVKVSLCERCDAEGNVSDGGTYLAIEASRAYSKVISDETQYNYCELRYRYAKQGEALPDTWETILTEDALSDNAKIVAGTLDTTSIYIVEIGVIDTVGVTSEAVYSILTEDIFTHEREDGDGFAFGMYSQGPGLDVGWDARFHKGVTIEGMSLKDYILSVIQNG